MRLQASEDFKRIGPLWLGTRHDPAAADKRSSKVTPRNGDGDDELSAVELPDEP
jgi:hypothetical protein